MGEPSTLKRNKASMRVLFTVLSIVAVAAACASRATKSTPARPPDNAGVIWIRDVTMVSPERSSLLRHAHVLCRGGRIAWVGGDRPPDPPPGTIEVDGSGRFLVPGLIDGHVHLGEVPGMTREQLAAMPSVADHYFQQLPRSYLYFGFTAVVDLNVIDRGRMAAIRAAPLGPKVFDCGNGLALANGYPMSFLPPEQRFALFPNFIYDARQAAAIPNIYSPADHTPRASVARVGAGGGICVKAYFEPGFGPQRGKLPTLTPELAGEIRAASVERHLPLLLHANSLSAHRFAIAAHVDAVVHGLWNWEPERPGAAGELPAAVREVLDDEVRARMGVMPTTRVISGLEDLFASAFLDDPQLAHVLPAELLAWYRSEAGRWFAREMKREFDGLPDERIQPIFGRTAAAGLSAAVYFAGRGGRLVFGSDTPSAPTYANPPGYNGYLELRALERAGIAPRQLIDAATRANAELFGLARDYGTIEVGKRASLLLLRGDPTESLAALDTIEVVVLEGRVVPRSELSAQ
jgi:imidazolonepropionase-like amidohydrolase